MISIKRWLHGRPLEEWSDTYALRSKRLSDGSEAKGRLMRRMVRGRWEYRLPTEAEKQYLLDGEVW